jgi:hypothetical protein
MKWVRKNVKEVQVLIVKNCNGGASTNSKRAHEPVVTMKVSVFVGREVRGRLDVKWDFVRTFYASRK